MNEYVSRVSNLDELAKLDRETVEDFCNPTIAELLRNFVDATDIHNNMENVEIELRLGRIVSSSKEYSDEWEKSSDSHIFESGVCAQDFEKIVDRAKDIFEERVNFDGDVLEKTKIPPRKKD